jgi:hypothetical protein
MSDDCLFSREKRRFENGFNTFAWAIQPNVKNALKQSGKEEESLNANLR